MKRSGIKNPDNNKLILFLLILIYGAVTFSTMINHEPWRDEAQAWLLARDLGAGELIRQLPMEGTPGLWHFLLFLLNQAGFSYQSQFILHWLLGFTAVVIFFLKAPFSLIFKVIFCFSYYLFFEYIIIARNYNLTVLMLIIIASLYHLRQRKPILIASLIFLLFNTNIHSFGIALSLSLIMGYELTRKKIDLSGIAAFVLIFLGFACLMLQIYPISPDQQNALVASNSAGFHLEPLLRAAQDAFLPGTQADSLVGFFFFIIFILFLLRMLNKVALFLLLLISIGWLYLIFAAIHEGSARQHGLIIIIMVFTLWLERYYPGQKDQADFCQIIKIFTFSDVSLHILKITLLVSCLSGIYHHYQEHNFLYSGGREAAGWISENLASDAVIIAYPSYAATSLLPYLPDHRFWYADREEYGTYMIWDKKFADNGYKLSYQDIIERSESHFDREERYYLLNKAIPAFEKSYQRLFRNSTTIFAQKDEDFYIYRAKEF
ncbi:MAG: hypothetical protein JW996_01520 [Candidatus Cloacimonetes bacterium]|nr:hypothetical protein [Candidatus Cloacimonadota bacterium]